MITISINTPQPGPRFTQFAIFMININYINCNSLWNLSGPWLGPSTIRIATDITISSQFQQARITHTPISQNYTTTRIQHCWLVRSSYTSSPLFGKLLPHKVCYTKEIFTICHRLMKTSINFTRRGNVSHFALISLMDELLNEIETIHETLILKTWKIQK